jgi:hypothetical protein
MIGKIFRAFSNDWKKFSGHFRETKGTKGTTTQARRRIARQLRQFPTIVFDIEKHENRFADKERLEGGWGETTGQLGRKTDGEAGGGWGRGRPARDDSGKRKPTENHLFSTIAHPAARLEAAPPEVTRCLSRRSCATSGGAASCCATSQGIRKGGAMGKRKERKGVGTKNAKVWSGRRAVMGFRWFVCFPFRCRWTRLRGGWEAANMRRGILILPP